MNKQRSNLRKEVKIVKIKGREERQRKKNGTVWYMPIWQWKTIIGLDIKDQLNIQIIYQERRYKVKKSI